MGILLTRNTYSIKLLLEGGCADVFLCCSHLTCALVSFSPVVVLLRLLADQVQYFWRHSDSNSLIRLPLSSNSTTSFPFMPVATTPFVSDSSESSPFWLNPLVLRHAILLLMVKNILNPSKGSFTPFRFRVECHDIQGLGEGWR